MQNGEIYNYVELQAELEGLGRRFATTSDTEVIAQAYAEWGRPAAGPMNGTSPSPSGIAGSRSSSSPATASACALFVAELGGDLVFASELKAILRHPAAGASSTGGLVELHDLVHLAGRVLVPGHPRAGPCALPPRGPEGIREERRWFPLLGRPDVTPAERAAGRGARRAPRRRHRLRLRADVPVAAYLSGGLDSSAIVAHALEQMDETLYSFGIGFEDRASTSAFQDRLTGARGLDLTGSTTGARDIAELLPQTVELAEKPTLRTAVAAPAPLGAVQDAASRSSRPARGRRALRRLRPLPRERGAPLLGARARVELRPLLLTRLNAFIGKDFKRSGAFLVGFYRKGLTETDDPLYSHRLRFANTSRLLSLLDLGVLERAAERGDPAERLEARLPSWFMEMTPLGRAQYLEIDLPEGYLLHSQGDRMLMGHSIEGASPSSTTASPSSPQAFPTSSGCAG